MSTSPAAAAEHDPSTSTITVDTRVLRRAIAATYLRAHAGEPAATTGTAERFADDVISSLGTFADEAPYEDRDDA